ncbi:hypothetical protein [Mycolicibacterium neoaurum]|nr:hypothetical protein [Mycolicibacterium neoaurum]
MVRMQEVFGMGADVGSPSYVNRGRLDERFKNALASRRHIAIHGGSKQGKSWLREKGLADPETIILQCVPGSTPESLIREALGRLGVEAKLKRTTTQEFEGKLDFSGAAELGKILAKAKAEGTVSGSAGRGSETEYEPIGKSPADLSWVSTTIAASGKRLVLEDFHYLDERVQKDLSFLLKAMGEYGLYVIVVGVWPKDHLLTYYNGDLEGRVEDIHLTWSDEELAKVVRQGCNALRIRIPEGVIDELVREASGSVGLVQRLAEQLCRAEGIEETTSGWSGTPTIGSRETLDIAKRAVAEQMEGRFQTFADNFVRGMRRLPEGLEVYKYLLQAASDASDHDLSEGIDSAALLASIDEHGGHAIRLSDLTQALDRIDRLQVKIEVRPSVLTYSKASRKLFLADRAFLFFRRNGEPRWPWMAGEPEITNDLSDGNPLVIDDFEDGSA